MSGLEGLLHQFILAEPQASAFSTLYRVTRFMQGGGKRKERGSFLSSIEGLVASFLRYSASVVFSIAQKVIGRALVAQDGALAYERLIYETVKGARAKVFVHRLRFLYAHGLAEASWKIS